MPQNLAIGTPREEMSEVVRRALGLYDEKLKALLEPDQSGKGLAIHPDSGDYLTAANPTYASREMRKRHPEGGYMTMHVGPAPDYALAGRILAGKLQEAFQDHQINSIDEADE
jgi:hypothetical protein